MIDLLKAHPWTAALGALILTVAVVGIVWGLATKGRWADRGLMVRDGHKLRWNLEALPLAVWYSADLPAPWVDAWLRAAAEIGKAVGKRVLFLLPLQSPPELDMDKVVGISLRPDTEQVVDKRHASTVLRWDKLTGQIYTAAITFPELDDADQIYAVTLHEACHALGLDHDEIRDSIMFPSLQDRPQALTDHDEALLRKVYG